MVHNITKGASLVNSSLSVSGVRGVAG